MALRLLLTVNLACVVDQSIDLLVLYEGSLLADVVVNCAIVVLLGTPSFLLSLLYA